jgi:hypothetical protein
VIYLEHRPIDGGQIETEWSARRFRVNDRHAKGGSGRLHPDPTDLFEAVAESANRAERVVLIGPGSAKDEFLRWTDRHARGVRDRVQAIEHAGHPSDGELVAMARRALGLEAPRMVWPRTETL